MRNFFACIATFSTKILVRRVSGKQNNKKPFFTNPEKSAEK